MRRAIISFDTIKQAVEQIAKTLHPQKVVLFGSYAYGKPGPDSDVDLLVVFKRRGKSDDYYQKVSEVLEPRTFPVDILVCSSIQIQKRLKIGDSFIREILEEGKVLYES